MDLQTIIDQVAAAVQSAPEKLAELAQDPRGTIEGIIGEGNLGDIDPAQIVDGLKERVAGLDLGSLDLTSLTDQLPEQLKGFTDNLDVAGIADQVGGFLGGLFGKK